MSNRLVKEKSPYLLQHKNNPVDWYPWGEEAFEEAKKRDCPIFLSVGYSTCHWCHVMERESFEDSEVADVLNRYFIGIKVDREERPDVDHIYMTFCQAMTGQGGWPLTVIMTPDKKPFFAGTYFPKKNRWGRPGLMDVLEQVRLKWQNERESVVQAGSSIVEAIEPHFGSRAGELSLDICREAFEQLSRRFDKKYGGFGSAPKFPTPHNLSFLLRYWKHSGEAKGLDMVKKTLISMREGGIYDHVGFGFSRYSTDEKWLVPHFEKMLYDNALLAIAYLEAFQASGEEIFAQTARDIFTYVLRDMSPPGGAFYSAEDADSEGEEGKFYVWEQREVLDILGEREGSIYAQLYDITPGGNFEGKSIPNLIGRDSEKVARQHNLSMEELTRMAQACRIKLYNAREKRVHPFKDDKILTAWNGLMCAALARGAAVLGEDKYLTEAERAADFIWENMRTKEGRLLARHREGESALPAYLDDYAFLAWAMLELYQSGFKPIYLKRALELVHEMTELFWDKDSGGFYFYGSDAEQLLARPREIYDSAIPSGNSVAAMVLLMLSRITGRSELEDLAEQTLKSFAGDAAFSPGNFTFYLSALLFALGSTREIVLVGNDLREEGFQRLLQAARKQFLPDAVLIFRPAGGGDGEIETLAPHIKGHVTVDGRAAAYVCKDYACLAPVTEPDKLVHEVRN